MLASFNSRRSSFKDMDDKEQSKFDLQRFEDYATGLSEPEFPVNFNLISQNGSIKVPIDSYRDLMNEFMTAMSINHGCLRVNKRKP